jgi:hypothetical protein
MRWRELHSRPRRHAAKAGIQHLGKPLIPAKAAIHCAPAVDAHGFHCWNAELSRDSARLGGERVSSLCLPKEKAPRERAPRVAAREASPRGSAVVRTARDPSRAPFGPFRPTPAGAEGTPAEQSQSAEAEAQTRNLLASSRRLRLHAEPIPAFVGMTTSSIASVLPEPMRPDDQPRESPYHSDMAGARMNPLARMRADRSAKPRAGGAA